MGTNYLKKYYLNDGKLAQRARLEFFRSLSTGRMIAFLGSMGTQAFGYGSWEQLRLTFTALALDVARQSSDDKLIEYIHRFHENSVDGNWDPQVGMSLIEEVLDAMKADLARLKAEGFKSSKSMQDWPLDHFATITQAMRAAVADRFRRPRNNWRIDRPGLADPADFERQYDVPTALWERLGIRRFATPSYDFELERVAMLGDQDNLDSDGRRTSPFDQLTQLRTRENENFSWDLGSGRIRRTFPDGWAIESDLMNRERIDRLIEFAVGTDDVNGHIMHVHGRACTASSMIITQRDYDQLYRREDLNRRPFELAKRVMMGGNPILFVGLGMSEADLNRDLQEFVSNNPYQRAAPTFLLWSTRTGRGLNKDKREAKRIDFLRRLGILTIFDSDLLELGDSSRKWETGPFPYVSDNRRADQDSGAQEARKKKLAEELAKAPPKDRAARKKIEEAQAKQDAFPSDDFHALGEAALETEWTWEWADSAWKEDLGDLYRCVAALDKASPHGSLPPTYLDPTLRERHIGSHWRSMEGLFTIPQDRRQKPTILWEVGYSRHSEPAPAWIGDLAKKCDRELICIIGTQGCGKGRAARQLTTHGHRALSGISQGRTLLINGCFSFDTDSLLDGVTRFLADAFGHPINHSDERPKTSRARLLNSMELGKSGVFGKRALVVLNGSERFFDLAGEPLSAELDQLLSNITGDPESKLPRKAKVQWVVFGTERVREYMKRLGARILEFDECCPDSQGDLERRVIPSFYLDEVWRSVQHETLPAESANEEDLRDRRAKLPSALRAEVERYIGNSSGRISGDGIDLRRAVYGALFDEVTMRRLLKSDSNAVRTARNLMKALAFTGLPTEEDVLRLLPGLDSADFTAVLNALVDAKLILKARGYRSAYGLGPARYALHRSLLTELRYRYGIPLSEAKLSTAFNMSLYVAQPIDGDIPDHDIHEELGAAVDDLIGGYRHKFERASPSPFDVISKKLGSTDDKSLLAEYNLLLDRAGSKCGSSRYPVDDDDKRAEIERLCGERHAQALRTAIALIRSYYSTTGLLTLDSGDRLIREGRDGVLLEHAERLDDLIDAYGKSAIARETMREGLRTLGKPAGSQKARRQLPDAVFNAAFGVCEPFYPDELVWLHNERGVVRLAMGDLYEARRSFDQAMQINRERVEAGEQQHNWRRIRINQLSVDIEMGDIGLAERKCAELRVFSTRTKMLREDRLAIALVEGFTGWIDHLRGRVEPALVHYQAACSALSELREVRAQAYFERLHANALGPSREPERRATLKRAQGLAESGVQMDLVHRLRITRANMILFSQQSASLEDRQRANRYLEEAHVYALHTGVHRVRLEAAMNMARARLHASDFDGALRFAMDAMMIATRYGMELRKITLRAVLAKIMAERGHPVTAEQLARTCIKMATRLRFQTAIDKASQVIIDIPRISTAISRSDQSGRRNF